MYSTPNIPSWMRDFRHPGYTNVFQLFPNESRLYGTESIFGDWGGETLFLAKDSAPTHVIKASGWRHAQRGLDKGGWRTNERLFHLASNVRGGKLYGSATANMLYDHPAWSRALKDFRRGDLHDYLVRVLEWVVVSMPNVRTVACLGAESWYLTCMAMNKPDCAPQWTAFRHSARLIAGEIGGKSLAAIAMYHPGARVSIAQMQSGWSVLTRFTQTTENLGALRDPNADASL